MRLQTVFMYRQFVPHRQFWVRKCYLRIKKATCFPGYEKYLYGADVKSDKVVVDGKFITGKGAGAAADFGFAMLAILKDKETADRVKETMQY